MIFLSFGSPLVFLTYKCPKPTFISPGGSIPAIIPNTARSLYLSDNLTIGMASSINKFSVPYTAYPKFLTSPVELTINPNISSSYKKSIYEHLCYPVKLLAPALNVSFITTRAPDVLLKYKSELFVSLLLLYILHFESY
jgi:hypothetical protein